MKISPKNIGSIGVERCILPSLLTDSSINQDLLPSLNVRISCTELLAGEKRNIADSPVFGCLKVTISGVPVPVYWSDNSKASPSITKLKCYQRHSNRIYWKHSNQIKLIVIIHRNNCSLIHEVLVFPHLSAKTPMSWLDFVCLFWCIFLVNFLRGAFQNTISVLNHYKCSNLTRYKSESISLDIINLYVFPQKDCFVFYALDSHCQYWQCHLGSLKVNKLQNSTLVHSRKLYYSKEICKLKWSKWKLEISSWYVYILT